MNIKSIVAFVFAVVLFSGCGGGGSPNPITIPVSKAESEKNVTVGTQVTLDGSGSTTASIASLNYNWVIKSKPAGSQAALSNATTATPSFIADVAGQYVIILIVSDGSVNGNEASLTITAAVPPPAAAGNSAPAANAGTAQTVTFGTVVTLDGSASSDANGDQLSYNWTLTSTPQSSAASTATMIGATTSTPSFTADKLGSYTASLIVYDGKAYSAEATVTITATVLNVVPVANAGTNQSVGTGSKVALSGRASSDANGDTLTYSWTFTSKPANSTAALLNPTSDVSTFIADMAGTYEASLIVYDGKAYSSPSKVSIYAVPPTYAIQGALIWMPVTLPANTWTAARDYCATTTINGKTGWTLPTIAQLTALDESLVLVGHGWTLGGTWSADWGGWGHLVFDLSDWYVNSDGTHVDEGADLWDYYFTCVHAYP